MRFLKSLVQAANPTGPAPASRRCRPAGQQLGPDSGARSERFEPRATLSGAPSAESLADASVSEPRVLAGTPHSRQPISPTVQILAVPVSSRPSDTWKRKTPISQ